MTKDLAIQIVKRVDTALCTQLPAGVGINLLGKDAALMNEYAQIAEDNINDAAKEGDISGCCAAYFSNLENFILTL